MELAVGLALVHRVAVEDWQYIPAITPLPLKHQLIKVGQRPTGYLLSDGNCTE